MAGMVSKVFEREGKVVLSLHGHYTREVARENVAEAARLFQARSRWEFVVDLRDLSGYDPAARTAWQDQLSELRSRIHTVIMIGGSPLIRMTGSAVCLYAGIKMRFADDLEAAFRLNPIASR